MLLIMFQYDAANGTLMRVYHSKSRRVRGTKVSIANTDYWTARVVWKLMTGREPRDVVDFVDGNPLNIRWNNLVELTHSEHRLLGSRAHRTSETGHRGVYRTKSGKYRVEFRHRGEKHVLGTFRTLREANSARARAVRQQIRMP